MNARSFASRALALTPPVTLSLALASAAAGAWLGCSSDGATVLDAGGTTGGGGNKDAGSHGDDSGIAIGDGGGGGDVDAGPAASADCPTYCATVMASCTGDNAQYATSDECLAACAFFPAGTTADTAGNTRGCRVYHAGLASTTPVPHCWHAGPYGYGACGDPCANFCALAVAQCGADAGLSGGPPYATVPDCTAACIAFARDDGGAKPSSYNATGPAAGNTLDCREFHLGAALQGAAGQQADCPNVAATSPTCQ